MFFLNQLVRRPADSSEMHQEEAKLLFEEAVSGVRESAQGSGFPSIGRDLVVFVTWSIADACGGVSASLVGTGACWNCGSFAMAVAPQIHRVFVSCRP